MTALDMPELDQGSDPEGLPQDPVGQQRPPPQVLPAPKDEHDLETSIGLIKQSLHERANKLNVEHLQRMAAAGQMQAYDAAQMQTATGGQMEEEMALMSYGMPQTNVRVPENRKAYEDWFADMERRQGSSPEGVNKQWPEVKKRYGEFHKLAQSFDSDQNQLRQHIQSSRDYYESPWRQGIEIATAPAKGVSGGYVGTNSRQEDLVSDVKAKIDELVTKRFPKGNVEQFANMLDKNPGTGKQTPGASEGQQAGAEREHYKQLLTDEAWSQLRKTLDRPGMTPKGAAAFTEKALETLGMLAPMGGLAKAGTMAATKAGLGKLATHVGSMLGFGAYMGASELSPAQQSRIARLPEGDRTTGEVAARIENGLTGVIFAPLYGLAGWGGSKLGGGLSKALGGSGEGLLGGLLKGAGSGLAMPLAPEIENQLKSVGTEHVPFLRDLVEKKLIAKPELQTPLVGMLNSAKAGDGQSFLANLTTYLKEAAPGMVAFGLAHGVAGMRTAFHAEQLDLLEGRLRETEAQRHKEIQKVANGERELEDQLEQGVDEAVAKVQEEAHGVPTREEELSERIGPEETQRVLGEAESIERTAVTELPQAVSEAKAEPEQAGQESRQVSKVDTSGNRRQEKLLSRRIARTEDPALKAELQAQRDELRRQRREQDAVATGAGKPIRPTGVEEAKGSALSAAAEAGDTPSRSAARGRSMALRYEEAARSTMLSPHERAAAATKAAEWTGYHKEVAAWEKAGSHGDEPLPPPRTVQGSYRLAVEQGERAARRLTEPMPVREQAAAKILAYQESEQRGVDQANETGEARHIEVGHVIEDMGGHKSTVEEITPTEVRVRNPEGEVESVSLREGRLPAELAVVRGTVTVRGGETEETVKSRNVGNLAVHKSVAGGGVSITHIPTGFRAWGGKKKIAEAVEMAKRLNQLADWSFESNKDSDKLKTAFEAVQQVLHEQESVVAREASKPPRSAQHEDAEAQQRDEPEHEDIVARPETESTSALPGDTDGKTQLASMHADLEAVTAIVDGAPSIFADLSSLKGAPGASSTNRVAKHAANVAKKSDGVVKEFAEFVAQHADLGATRHGDRFAAEMVYQWQNAKHNWGIDPRGASMGELTRYMQEGLSKIRKEVLITKNVDAFTHWAANQSALLSGPWGVAARVHPDGRAILRQVAEMEEGRMPSGQAGSIQLGGAWIGMPARWTGIAAKNVFNYIWHMRRDNLARLLEQANANPRTKAQLLHRLTFNAFAMPIGDKGFVARDRGIAVEMARTQVAKGHHDLNNVKDGMLRDALRDPEVNKMLTPLLGDPKGAETKAIRARTDEPAKQAVEAADKLVVWHKKIKATIIETHPTTHRLRETMKAAYKDIRNFEARIIHLRDENAPKKQIDALERRLKVAEDFHKRLSEVFDTHKQTWGLDDYIHHISKWEIVGGAAQGMHKETPSGVSAIEAKRRIYTPIVRERQGRLEKVTYTTPEGTKQKGLLSADAARAINQYLYHSTAQIYENQFHQKIDVPVFGNLERLDGRELLRGRHEVVFGELKHVINLGFHKAIPAAGGPPGKPIKIAGYVKGKRGEPAKGGKVLLWVGDKDKIPDKKLLKNAEWVRAHTQSDKHPDRGLVMLDKHIASQTLRALKGGLFDKMDPYMQRNLIKYINDPGAFKESVGGMLGDEWSRLSRISNKVARGTSTLFVASALWASPRNAFNNLLSGVALNHFFGVGAKALADSARVVGKTMATAARRAAGRGLGVEPKAEIDPDNLVLSDTIERQYRTPKEVLDKMSPEKRAERIKRDDGDVAMHESGVVFGNNLVTQGRSPSEKLWGEIPQPGKWRLPQWQRLRQQVLREEARAPGDKPTYTLMNPGETARPLPGGGFKRQPAGLIEKAENVVGNVANIAGAIVKPIAKLGYVPFNAAEIAIRAPAFRQAFNDAIDKGMTRDEAKAQGMMAVHLTSMIYNYALKSPFLNHPIGQALSTLSTWTIGVGGRQMALPWNRFFALAAFNTACMALGAQLFGLHWFNQFGGSTSDLPGGEKAQNRLFGLGWKTAKDPEGLSFKGPLYNIVDKVFDVHALPLPFSVMTKAGWVASTLEHLGKAGAAVATGAGTEGAKEFRLALKMFDPTQWNVTKQFVKAFDEANTPEAGGGAVYHPLGQARPKGTVVMDSQGWKRFGLEMLPGSLINEARQYIDTQLKHAQNAVITSRTKEFNEQGRQLMAHLGSKKLSELPPEDQAVWKGMRTDLEKRAKDLNLKMDRSRLVEWQKEAEYERTTDSRMRSALAAPTKGAKVRAITELLEDPGYNLSKERWAQLVKHVSGASGSMSAWLSDPGTPVPEAERKKLGEAYKRRKSTW